MQEKKEEINQEEEERYDRQIRLWGLEAQNRLRNAKVLVIGMGGVGAEVVKNLMLTGLKSMTLVDDKKVSENDYASQFLIPPDSEGQNRALASKQATQALNPLVKLTALGVGNIASEVNEDFLRQFDIVIVTDQKYSTICRFNEISRLHNIGFLAGGAFGWNGYAFNDFDGHTFLLPKPKNLGEMTLGDDVEDENDEPQGKKFKSDAKTTEVATLEDEEDKVLQSIKFPSFGEAMNTDFASLATKTKRKARSAAYSLPPSYFLIRALLRAYDEGENSGEIDEAELKERWQDELTLAKLDTQDGVPCPKDDQLKLYLGPQLNPVCAIVGAIIAGEAIKAVSKYGVPHENLFVYSAIDTTGIVCKLPLKSG